MPLTSRYYPYDIRTIFGASKLQKKKFIDTCGGIKIPAYYTTNSSIVLTPVTDTDTQGRQTLQTISDGLKKIDKTDLLNKHKIYIPVAEEQKILWLFKRDHWVTLEYDLATHQATLLDSRPWILSFLYPYTAIKNQLKEGLLAILGEKKEFSFKAIHQSVQYNDTHCGAWTSRNILDLSGGNGLPPTTMSEQQNKYRPTDEAHIIQGNITLAAAAKASSNSTASRWKTVPHEPKSSMDSSIDPNSTDDFELASSSVNYAGVG